MNSSATDNIEIFFHKINCTELLDYNYSDDVKSPNCSNDISLFNVNPIEMTKTVQIFLKTIYALIFILGIGGNSLVIHVVTKFSKMQTVTNTYILNLAIADIMYLMGLPFLVITLGIRQWIFGHLMCKIYMVATSLSQFVSSFFLAIMSADRYIAVCRPVNSRNFRTPFVSKIIALSAWALATVMIVPIFMYATTFETSKSTHCNIYWSVPSTINAQEVFSYYSLVTSFVIPLMLIFVFYSLVACKLGCLDMNSKISTKKSSKRKVTKLVLTLVLVYAFCYSPYWARQMQLLHSPPMRSHSTAQLLMFLLFSCLTYFNSTLNPILYAFLSENFKQSFKKVCFCGWKSKIMAPPKTSKGRKRRNSSNQQHSSVNMMELHPEENNVGVLSVENSFLSPNFNKTRSETTLLKMKLNNSLKKSDQNRFRFPSQSLPEQATYISGKLTCL